MHGIKAVAVGGGTGLPIALQSLKLFAGDITAIVSVADDGGSSGRLREDMGMLPPGDIRNCLVALARNDSFASLFKYRFKQGNGITGHNLGNLIIAALVEQCGSFDAAIKAAADLLEVNGRVLPSTIGKVTLHADTFDGEPIKGQVKIAQTTKPIKEVYLDPADVEAYPEAVQAILEADQIVIGPGSVFTSILPNLIVTGIGQALTETKARKIYICNVMTQPGETDLFTACDHISAIIEHGSKSWIDAIIINTKQVEEETLVALAEDRRFPVSINNEQITRLGIPVLYADVINEAKPTSHDPEKLALILRDL